MIRDPKFAFAALMLSIAATPALADVKAGVDAWSRGDYPAAVKEWRQPAIDGDADAQFNLGQAYKLGRGVPADLTQAEDWYRKAALQGHLQAEDNYGLVMFQNGNRQGAMPWIQKSAARGEPRSQYVLGTALFNGDMIAKDWVQAYALMTRASASGLAPASASLAQMDRYIPLEQRQKGLVVARTMEEQAAKPVAVAAATPAVRPPVRATPIIRATELPPSTPQPVDPVMAEPEPAMPKPVAPRPAAVKPPAQPVITGKGWRVQLGAFGEGATARNLWKTLERRHDSLGGLQPFLVVAGPVTRLQAGPLASKAAANALCATLQASGQACLPVAP